VKKPIHAGEKFTNDNLTIRRPAAGLSPRYWDEVMGKTATASLEPGDGLAPEHIDRFKNA
jgi:sialic acid synthase SpsE